MVGHKDRNKAENTVREETMKTRKDQIDIFTWRYFHDIIYIKCVVESYE